VRAPSVDWMVISETQFAQVVRKVAVGRGRYSRVADGHTWRRCIVRRVLQTSRDLSVSHLQYEALETSESLTSLLAPVTRSVIDSISSFLLWSAVNAFQGFPALQASPARGLSVTPKPA
jgi:hypothetical protein